MIAVALTPNVPYPNPERIRTLRGKARWTQQEAADALYVTARTFARWERGEQPMPRNVWELMHYKVADELERQQVETEAELKKLRGE